jgi:hypothetical protein
MSRRAVLGAGAIFAVILISWLFWHAAPPQMGDDEGVSKAVDALFTAVTARNEKLLDDCEGRLGALTEEGNLPIAAADFLDSVIDEARDGKWRPAAERLYGFMRAQRRGGEP